MFSRRLATVVCGTCTRRVVSRSMSIKGVSAEIFKTKKSPYPLGPQRSNAETLVAKVDVISVPGNVAICDGGGGVLGHPIEYIQLNTRDGKPAVCLYCGLRYASSGPQHH